MISFSRLALKSKNPRLLADFLSFLFDAAIEDLGEECFELEIMQMKILIQKGTVGANPSTDFQLQASEVSDIEEWNQKIEFFFYKQGLKFKLPTQTEEGLKFYDTDKRAWLLRKPTNLVTQIADKIHQDVRYF